MKNTNKHFNLKEYFARREALLRLRALSERSLLDCGISPELLENGVKAWPWKERLDEPSQIKFLLPVHGADGPFTEKHTDNSWSVPELPLQKDAA